MIKWSRKKLIEQGYTIENAKIVSADISTVDHACAYLQIVLEGDGWGTVYGGYCLGRAGSYLDFDEIECSSGKGFESILKIMWTIGVDSLRCLKGEYVRVATKGWGSSVKIIGHITKDQWFDYQSFFEEEKNNVN
jgi:hypothetical protein